MNSSTPLGKGKFFFRFANIFRKAWTILGIALVIFLVLEITARIGYTIRDNRENEQIDRLILASDIYRNQDWAPDYFREEQETLWIARSQWHSYVYWRHSPHHGKYINIDPNGIRYTWNPTSIVSPDPIKIFVFGGSALWGTGVRDEYTIPSLLSKKLAAQGRAARVTNFGEEGYVSTQEVITLVVELQKGNVPDIVIFYDGANDVFSAFQQGVAGIPQNEFNRAAEFNQFNWRGGIVEKLALYRLGTSLANPSHPARTEAADAALANATLDTYFANVRTVESLALEYGFRAAFYWQPVIYNKKNLSGWEKQQLNTYGEERFFALVNQRLDARTIAQTHPGFHDSSAAFGDQSETVFLDLFHISEAGNQRIADLVLEELKMR